MRTGAGDSHVKWNVPARISAPSTASPMTRQAMGMSRAKSADVGDLGEGRVGGVSSETRASRPNSTAPTQGSARSHHRRSGRQARSV